VISGTEEYDSTRLFDRPVLLRVWENDRLIRLRLQENGLAAKCYWFLATKSQPLVVVSLFHHSRISVT